MKDKFKYLFMAVLICAFVYLGYDRVTATEYIKQGQAEIYIPKEWNSAIAKSINSKDIGLYIDGKKIEIKSGKAIMDESMTLMLPSGVITEAFGCAVHLYEGENLLIEKGNVSVSLKIGDVLVNVNESTDLVAVAPLKDDAGVVYVPLDCIIENFGYTYKWDMLNNQATLMNDNPEERNIPYSYSYAKMGRAPKIKNQGYFGTCWATAALTAIESALLPEEAIELSIDHMSISNSFNISQYDGGDYSMAIAYLAAWQGPVYEVDDPSGDGKSDGSLRPVKHIQEVQTIPSKDFETIKKMVYLYGGVSTSLYTSLNDSYGVSRYYNKETNSYCYIGEAKPNHDVVIVGWDDNYPKENFNSKLEGNGAFICQNSWGENFGEDGRFYVSYYDTNIGIHNVVYTRIDSVDNYDDIYQSDLCGWRGNLGYEKESAYFANVYTARSFSELAAVSFYATDVDTYYEIAVCHYFNDSSDLNSNTGVLASGTLNNAGYYTIDLNKSVFLAPGEKFAIVMYISTPNSTRPVAVEIATDYKTQSVDITDGEGYISYTGRIWKNVEEEYNCNLCLKGFTKQK
ncbi:MAG: cell surface protein [Clostridiales bacterium]|nr:cell surface protein [Clostridiales bacterium]